MYLIVHPASPIPKATILFQALIFSSITTLIFKQWNSAFLIISYCISFIFVNLVYCGFG